jgi:hypothetical protein
MKNNKKELAAKAKEKQQNERLPNNAVPPGFRCAQPGEQAALGRRLRRGQQFCTVEIAANK